MQNDAKRPNQAIAADYRRMKTLPYVYKAPVSAVIERAADETNAVNMFSLAGFSAYIASHIVRR